MQNQTIKLGMVISVVMVAILATGMTSAVHRVVTADVMPVASIATITTLITIPSLIV